ncbi:ADP-ribosylglycohydrolase family protein [Brachybacterium paraconglomeratum]|uniref:ADP-ribosylglycohydrolase family protein n=1 Tax=Brachybacterium paraconglomeratum TaxID=173362 RepID=UPI0035198A6E
MTPSPALTAPDRAHGALLGLALGDALGMPTQSLPHARIAALHGRVDRLLDAAGDQPIAPGMPAGSITDDTEQALLLARLLLDGDSHVDPHALAAALISWEQDMIARGSRDLLGPSTKAALEKLQAGVPVEETGRYGTTNGAAMRIAPVGIAVTPGDALLDAVVEASQVTHLTGLGISGAAAIAGAVSAALEGADTDQALETALDLSAQGASRGSWIAGASIPARVRAFRAPLRALEPAARDEFLRDVVGTSVQSQESVVAALLLVDLGREDPFGALCTAASLGGDTDTVAAMAGAVLGALHGTDAFPPAMTAQVREVNGLDLAPLAEELLALRRRTTA